MREGEGEREREREGDADNEAGMDDARDGWIDTSSVCTAVLYFKMSFKG